MNTGYDAVSLHYPTLSAFLAAVAARPQHGLHCGSPSVSTLLLLRQAAVSSAPQSGSQHLAPTYGGCT
jgi:hypothetical protein